MEKRRQFAPPGDDPNLSPNLPARVLAYFHPDDPAYIHLTDGQGRCLGTWLRRSLVHDHDSLQAAIRYSQAALRTAKDQADQLAAPDLQAIETLRARNAELIQSNTFTAVSTVSDSAPSNRPSATSEVAAALTSIPRSRQQSQNSRATAEQLAAALDDI